MVCVGGKIKVIDDQTVWASLSVMKKGGAVVDPSWVGITLYYWTISDRQQKELQPS